MKKQDLTALPAAWEFYFCSIEKHPASIMVDLAWEEFAPVRGHAELVEVELLLLSPDGDGLSDTSEAPRLFAMEDQLAAGMAKSLNAWYVGRLTGKGKRVFYFYTPTSMDISHAVDATLEDFPEYNWLVKHQYDPEWTLYRELLLPSEEEAHLIRNRRAFDELARRGDTFSARRPVNHQFTFPTQKQAESFLKKAGMGSIAYQTEPKDSGTTLTFSTTHAMMRAELDEITWDFAQLAKSCKGSYLGWRSEVVTFG
ncbi:MAG: DUF695 domain-containing protein [Bacteroidia bacterium]|nr:DUF695 domain-containing protein [Bacteroidia bacterium]